MDCIFKYGVASIIISICGFIKRWFIYKAVSTSFYIFHWNICCCSYCLMAQIYTASSKACVFNWVKWWWLSISSDGISLSSKFFLQLLFDGTNLTASSKACVFNWGKWWWLSISSDGISLFSKLLFLYSYQRTSGSTLLSTPHYTWYNRGRSLCSAAIAPSLCKCPTSRCYRCF